jgi:hypothetical protein
MRKVIIGLCLVGVLGLVGCGSDKSEATVNVDARFQIIYQQDQGFGSYLTIYQDKETGKKYIFKKAGYAGGLCELDESK